mgnify:CR=1 FL=1
MTGYRAFNRVFVKTMPVLSEGFQIETEISIHAVDKRWRIVDVPIDYRDRPEGATRKLSTFGDWGEGLESNYRRCSRIIVLWRFLDGLLYCLLSLQQLQRCLFFLNMLKQD